MLLSYYIILPILKHSIFFSTSYGCVTCDYNICHASIILLCPSLKKLKNKIKKNKKRNKNKRKIKLSSSFSTLIHCVSCKGCF